MKFKRKILLLGASQYAIRTIQLLKNEGYYVMVIDRNPDSVGFQYADDFEAIDFSNIESTLGFAKKNKINGIMPLNDYGVIAAAIIANKMNLPGISIESARLVTDKALMREAWRKSGVPIPKFAVVKSLSSAEKCTSKMGFPVILKPADSRGGGSRGVSVAFNNYQLERAYAFATSFYSDSRILVEELVQGTEYSVETLVIDGVCQVLAIADNIKAPYPFRVNKQLLYPADLDAAQKTIILNAVKEAIFALKLNMAIVHVELALTERGAVLFEVGARPGGGAIPYLVERAYGINYIGIYAQLLTGHSDIKINVCKEVVKPTGYHFFIFPESEGILKDIPEIDLNEIIGCSEIKLFISKGKRILAVKTGLDRHGYALIHADSRAGLVKLGKSLDLKINKMLLGELTSHCI